MGLRRLAPLIAATSLVATQATNVFDDLVDASSPKEGVCTGICGRLIAGAACQCNDWCVELKNCCKDYFNCPGARTEQEDPSVIVGSSTEEAAPGTEEAPSTASSTAAVSNRYAYVLQTTEAAPLSTTATTATLTSLTSTKTFTTSSFTLTTASTTSVTTATTTKTFTTTATTARIPVTEPALTCEGLGPVNRTITVKGTVRSYQIYIPQAAGRHMPLWFLMHGTGNPVQHFMDYSGLDKFAQAEGKFAYIAPQAVGEHAAFNVGDHSQPVADEADDVAFVAALLDEVHDVHCIDRRHIHCAGYSNGARFCMLLASEMSNIFASVAVVSGIRFPHPNKATRSMPVLAFHGTADAVNPWEGNGHSYWQASVLSAFNDWAEFNGCRNVVDNPDFDLVTGHVYATEYVKGCRNNASTVLVKLVGFGHTWPGSKISKPWVGRCNREISANAVIQDFFSKHPMPMDEKLGATVLASSRHPLATAPVQRSGLLVASAIGLLFVLGCLVPSRRWWKRPSQTQHSDSDVESHSLLLQ